MSLTYFLGSAAALAVAGYVVFRVFRIVFRLTHFVKNTEIRLKGISLGQGGQINTPLGSLDLQVHDAHDAGLESIPKYPGARPFESSAEYEIRIHAPGRDGRFVEKTYWTTDAFQIVVDYYKREFPTWKEDREFMSDTAGGYRCLDQSEGCIRSIEVRCDGFAMRSAKVYPEARTIIKYSVLYGNLPSLPHKVEGQTSSQTYMSDRVSHS